jgi:HEAT repeat protein
VGRGVASPDSKKRIEAADRLEGFREKALPALDALVAVLKDSDPQVRVLAAKALGNLDETGTPAVKGLLDAAKTSDTRTRAAAALALGRICQMHGGDAVELLAGMLSDRRRTCG